MLLISALSVTSFGISALPLITEAQASCWRSSITTSYTTQHKQHQQLEFNHYSGKAFDWTNLCVVHDESSKCSMGFLAHITFLPVNAALWRGVSPTLFGKLASAPAYEKDKGVRIWPTTPKCAFKYTFGVKRHWSL